MYTKDQMRQFGDWLASRKDVVTGSQIDEYIDGIATVGSADVVDRIDAIMKTELEKVVSADGKSVWDEILDHEVPLAIPRALATLIEAEVERRVRNIWEAGVVHGYGHALRSAVPRDVSKDEQAFQLAINKSPKS